MRTSPTDRGYALIKEEEDGTSTVVVAGSVSADGQPAEVSAIHTGVSQVSISTEVPMAEHNLVRWALRIVEVFDDGDGVLHILGPWAHQRPLDAQAN